MLPASFKSWLGNWQEWGSIVLLFLALEIAVRSIEQAQWITPQPSLSLVLALAVLTAWLLCKSRLPGAVTHPLVVVLGALVTVWQASNLLPSLEIASRVNQLIVALQSWWQATIAAEPSEGTIQFAVFLIFFTWIIGYISTWFILRRQNAWVAVSLGAITILVNLGNLPEKQYSFFLFYLLASLLLVGQMNLTRHYYWFKKDKINYPNRGIIYFTASLLCLSVLAVSITWRTPEIRVNRLETLVSTTIPLRKNIEEHCMNFLAAVPAKQPFLRSSEQSTLVFGDSFGQGDKIQFVITSERPCYWRTQMYDIYTSSGWTSSNATEHILRQEIPKTEVAKISNRREITYTVVTRLMTDILLTTGEFISSDIPVLVRTLAPLRFDIDLLHPSNDSSLPPDVASLARSLRDIQAANKQFSPYELRRSLPEDLMLTGIGAAPYHSTEASPIRQPISDSPQLTTIEVTRMQIGGRDTIAVITPHLLRPDQHYTVTASISSATPGDLSEAGDDYPHWLTDYYLQLPPTLPERVKKLSEIVTEKAESPYDKALAIRQYLSQIRYSSEIKAPPEGVDGVDYFLFAQKSGNCVHFASAMVVMLRSVDVPSRLCIGYLPSEWDASTGSSALRAKHRHAWPEVYFLGYDWVEFEVTPVLDNESELILGIGSEFDEDTEAWEAWLEEEMEGEVLDGGGGGTTHRNWLGPILPFVIIGVILLLFILRSIITHWLRRYMRPGDAPEVYGKMCFLASLVKLGPEPQQTPLEYCVKLASAFPLQAEALDNIVHAYVESRFSPRKELGQLQKGMLQKSWREVYPVFFKRLFHLRY